MLAGQYGLATHGYPQGVYVPLRQHFLGVGSPTRIAACSRWDRSRHPEPLRAEAVAPADRTTSNARPASFIRMSMGLREWDTSYRTGLADRPQSVPAASCTRLTGREMGFSPSNSRVKVSS